VTSLEFRDRLARRARRGKAHLTLAMLDPLEAYFRLLTQWNAKINLTALLLENPTDETFDRLFVEPLAASRQLDQIATRFKSGTPPVWFDLGSGGGSPAIPLKIARPTLQLTMIESKERKCAFLREAVRVSGLSSTSVLNGRFEDVSRNPTYSGTVDLVTVRAVRPDQDLFETASSLLRDGGRLAMFRPAHVSSSDPPGFCRVCTVQLLDDPAAFLTLLRRVPRGTSDRDGQLK
jgi:16S rRNA (guanine527-N7)-methyltransferase